MSDLSILFPTQPSSGPSHATDWYQGQRHQAEARLSGAYPIQPVQPDASQVMFGEKPAAAPAAKADDDPVKLFDSEGGDFDDSAVSGFFDGFAGTAIAEGDAERAQALTAAKDAMIADFKTAGTDPAALREAFDVVKDRQADTVFGSVSDERLAADQA